METLYIGIVVAVYLAITAYLGWLGFKQTTNAADFLVAGRKQHPIIMALSYGATFISTSAIVGFGGAAAVFGMGLLWLTFLNILVGIFIAFVFFGKRTRKMGHNLDAHTFPELLGKRFDSRFIQGTTGLLIFLFMPIYAGSVLIGGAIFIAQTFSISYDAAVLGFTIITAVYVVFGGLKGVMYTDAFQGVLMFIGMALLLIYAYTSVGGVMAGHTALSKLAPEAKILFGKGGHMGWTSMPAFGSAMWMQLVTTIVMGVGIGVLAQPQLIVRFMTVKSNKEINRAVLVGGVFILFMTGVAFTVGALSNVYFWNNPKYQTVAIEAVKMAQAEKEGKVYKPVVSVELTKKREADAAAALLNPAPAKAAEAVKEPVKPAAAAAQPAAPAPKTGAAAPVPAKPKSSGALTDAIIPLFINEAMPKWFIPIFLITLLAAAMSTLSSQFHTMGTALARDVYEKGLNIKSKNTVLVNRMGTLFTIILSLGVAIYLPRFFETGSAIIAKGTAIFFGLCACAIIPMYVGALYSKRFTKAAAKWGFVAGVAVSLLWMAFVHSAEAAPLGICLALTGKTSLLDPKSWISNLDPLIAALPVSIIVSLLVSALTSPMDKEHLQKCFNGIEKA